MKQLHDAEKQRGWVATTQATHPLVARRLNLAAFPRGTHG